MRERQSSGRRGRPIKKQGDKRKSREEVKQDQTNSTFITSAVNRTSENKTTTSERNSANEMCVWAYFSHRHHPPNLADCMSDPLPSDGAQLEISPITSFNIFHPLEFQGHKNVTQPEKQWKLRENWARPKSLPLTAFKQHIYETWNFI